MVTISTLYKTSDMRWLIFVLLFFCQFLYLQNGVCQGTFTLKFEMVDAALIYNNHVGNEWAVSVVIRTGGREYHIHRVGSAVVVPVSANSGIEIAGYATERDTYPDVGYKTHVLDLIEIVKDLPGLIILDPVVREGHGRYSGNTAQWKLSVRVSPGSGA